MKLQLKKIFEYSRKNISKEFLKNLHAHINLQLQYLFFDLYANAFYLFGFCCPELLALSGFRVRE